MSESAFATEILKWAKVYKWRAFHVRNSGFGGQTYVQGDKGFPDLVMVKDGHMVFAELKIGKAGTLKGDPTPEQVAWLNALEDCYPPHAEETTIFTYVWRPEDWSKILVVLSGKN